jgi:hypothetical protein
MGRRPALAAGPLQATSLPFVVAASQIGVDIGALSPVTGAALVSAGLLSVLLFPAAALSLLRSRPPVREQDAGRGTEVVATPRPGSVPTP